MNAPMLNKNLQDLLSGLVNVELIPSVEVGNLILDSRELQKGDVFIAVAGTQAHGLDYLQNALSASPALILFEPTENIQIYKQMVFHV